MKKNICIGVMITLMMILSYFAIVSSLTGFRLIVYRISVNNIVEDRKETSSTMSRQQYEREYDAIVDNGYNKLVNSDNKIVKTMANSNVFVKFVWYIAANAYLIFEGRYIYVLITRYQNKKRHHKRNKINIRQKKIVA